MIFFVVQRDRILFKLRQEPGKLVSAAKASEAQTSPQSMDCAFASGESMYVQTEAMIFAAAEKAKDWDGLIFKLQLEGFSVKPGDTLKLPFGKL